MSVSMQQINQEIARQDWNSAELHLKQGLQDHPESAKGWYFLAQVEGKLNHLGEAKNALEHADAIDPNHSYAGNLQTYNDLYNRVMVAQAVQTSPVQYTATVAQPAPVYPSGKVDTDHSGLWGFVGVAILVVMAYVFYKQWKKGKRDVLLNSSSIDRTPPRTVTVPASTSEASQPVVTPTQVIPPADAIRNTPARIVPPPVVREVRYASPPPPYYPPAPPARSNTSTFVEGMVAGAVADEVIRSITKPTPAPVYTPPPAPAPAPRDDFDYGSSRSSSSSFDTGSSSSSDWGSSSSSFDSGSSSFDSGSSGGSDW